MTFLKMVRAGYLLTGAGLLSLGTFSTAATAQQPVASSETETREYRIPPGWMTAALTQLIEQSGREVIYRSDDVRGKQSRGVQGRMTVADALSRVLAGTGLNAEFDRSGAIVITSGVQVSLNDPEDNSEDASKEPILVLGSRIEGVDQTQRVEQLNREDFEKRGVNTVEDALRTVLQNFSSTNTFSNTNNDRREADIALGPVADGVSTVNLRGLGSENTLVLVNGRRVAGAAGIAENLTNIASIPLAAIERIEVLPDGASAAYGSEAVGGVVNIVLRDDYEGAQVSARYENSSTGADARSISLTAGKTWSGGQITGSVSYRKSDPINAIDAGYTTNFYPGIFRDGSDLDLRTLISPTSEIRLVTPVANLLGLPRRGALPVGSDGTNFALSDIVPFEDVAELVDLVPEFLGVEQEQIGFSLNLKQDISDELEFFVTILGSRNETFRQGTIGVTAPIRIPNTNAFSPFPPFPGIFNPGIRYFPNQELADGLIDLPEFRTETSQFTVNSGLKWDISDRISWEFGGGFSRSENTFSNTGIPNFNRPEAQAVITSADPNIALNLFGDGSAQNPEAIRTLFGGSVSGEPVSKLFSLDMAIKARLFDFGAGSVRSVVGAEYREEQIRNSTILAGSTAGIDSSTREVTSIFGEVYVPIFSSRNAIPGFQSLGVSLQARYDRYFSNSEFGLDMSGEPLRQDVTFDNVAPRIGLAYSPAKGVNLRASWGEAFRAPTVAEISTLRVIMFNGSIIDPFDPVSPGSRVFVPFSILGANDELRPESSDNYSVGLSLRPEFAPGLKIDVDWARVDFADRIVDTSLFQFALPVEEFLQLPGVAQRDESGALTAVINRPINLQRRVVETIDAKVGYEFETEMAGEFLIQGEVTYYIDLFDQISEDRPEIRLLGTSRGPAEYRLRGQLGWRKGAGGLDLYVNHTPSNLNDFNVEFDPALGETVRLPIDVPSYTTFDLTGFYTFEKLDLRIGAGARNLFDADFPLSPLGRVPYDAARVDPRGRVAYIELTKSF